MIGFGTWGLSGKDYGFISAKKSKNLILKSVNSGIKFFDTAPLYGNGKVEKILGEAIKENKGLRKKITICTKFGLLPHKNHNLKILFCGGAKLDYKSQIKFEKKNTRKPHNNKCLATSIKQNCKNTHAYLHF